MVVLEEVRFQKRFLKYPLYSLYRAAKHSSGTRINQGFAGKVDWSLSKGREIILYRPKNSPCSVNSEFQSTTDSQSWDASTVA